MTEFHVDVQTPDGVMACFAAHPDGAGPYPAVILYMDAPGIREELRDFARRIAGEGYFCLLPDMYWRAGTLRFDMQTDPEATFPLMLKTMETINLEKIKRDTQGMIDYLDANDTVRGPYGCIGYCMSGQYVVMAAGEFPNEIVASASLYGVQIVTGEPDSPHLKAADVKGELYLGFAEHDPWVEDNVIPTLNEHLADSGVNFDLEIHPKTEHGFCFPQRPAYVEDSAEIVWHKVFAMYERQLKNA